MGRGARQGNQAMRVAALPRRLSKPERLGQKRYSVKSRNNRTGRRGSEPGYIRGHIEWARGRRRYYVYVDEEIAAADSNGRLHWIPTDHQFHAANLDNGLDISTARKQCDQLNKQPQGPTVNKEIDVDGMLTIGISDKQYDSSIERINVSEREVMKFDVTKPDQARKAKEHYDKVSGIVNRELAEEVERAVTHLKLTDSERAEQLFTDAETVEKSNTAKQFAEALRKGDADHLIEQAGAEQEKADEQVNEVNQVDRARRAQETLRSLAGS